MNWFVFWIVIYVVLLILLTLRYVKIKNIESYLINNRNTGTLQLVFTILATFVGGGVSMGLIAFGYESGLAAVAIGIAYVIGFFILSRYAGKMYKEGREFGLYSFPQYLKKKYRIKENDKSGQMFIGVVSLINIFIFFFLLAAQFVGMASLLEYSFGVGYELAAIISCIIVIFYTAMAGLSGVIITDFVQFIVIILLILFIFIPGVIDDTQWFARLQELPNSMVNGTSEGMIFLIAVPLFLSWSLLVRMDIWQRILAAKSETVARKVSLWSGIGMLPFYFIFPLVGMTVRLNYSLDNAKDATFYFMTDHVGGVFLGFAVVGLISALMSSGDSFLNVISVSVVKDFRKRIDFSAKREILFIRLAVVVFGSIAMLMALVFPDIVDLMVVGVSTIAIFVPATLVALKRDDASDYRNIAFISILTGFIVNISFFIWGVVAPEQFSAKSSFIPAFIVSVLIMLMGMLIKRPSRKHDK